MKFRILRSAEDQTGAGPVDPTQTPRMRPGRPRSLRPVMAAPAQPRVEDATPVTSARGRPTDQDRRARRLGLYGGKQALLRRFTLDIPDKTVTALIGPSGCGKSTFLRTMNRMNDTIAGLPRSPAGSRWTSEDINDRSIDPVLLRARVGMVFQKSEPLPEVRSTRTSPTGPRSTAWPSSKSRDGRRRRKGLAEARGPVGRGRRPPAVDRPWACPAANSSVWSSPAPSPSIPRSS